MPRPLFPIALTLAVLATGCGGGGGGGGTPAQLPRLELRDAAFAVDTETTELPVILSGTAESQPSLIQFELVTDGSQLEFTGEVTGTVPGVSTVAGQRVAPGLLRIVLGDTSAMTDPAALPDGALLTATVRRAAGAVAGTPVEVRLENYRATDVAGVETGLDQGPVTAQITP